MDPMQSDIMERALSFAERAHAGQVHRDGRDAIEHPRRVAENFRGDPEMYAIAILHDVLEDCPEVTFREVVEAFGNRIAVGVIAMTRGEKESWNDYIFRVKQDPIAVRIKIADIQDNIARCVPTDKMHAKLPMYKKTLSDLSKLCA